MDEPTLESLRAQGALRDDPVRLHFLEVLSARLPGQAPGVRRVLEQRLQRALSACAEPTRRTGDSGGRSAAPAGPSPLARLNSELESRTRAQAERARRAGHPAGAELQSVREFSGVWGRIRAEQQVVQALGQAPENAGPLNPLRLVLRSLSLMKDLSPDYLQGLLCQVESLAWLEQANARPKSLGQPPRTSKAGRARRPER